MKMNDFALLYQSINCIFREKRKKMAGVTLKICIFARR